MPPQLRCGFHPCLRTYYMKFFLSAILTPPANTSSSRNLAVVVQWCHVPSVAAFPCWRSEYCLQQGLRRASREELLLREFDVFWGFQVLRIRTYANVNDFDEVPWCLCSIRSSWVSICWFCLGEVLTEVQAVGWLAIPWLVSTDALNSRSKLK